jgi:hypothetical protein
MPTTESVFGSVPNRAFSAHGSAMPAAPHSTPTSLSTLPIFVLRDARLTDGPKSEIRGGTFEWLPKSLAEMVERQGDAIILTACSVMKSATRPSGGGVHPRSELAVLPFSDSGPLEQAGALRIMRSDADVAMHREIWAKHTAEGLDMMKRAKEMHREADDLYRRAQSPSRLPSFDWGSAKAQRKPRADSAAEPSAAS